MNEWIKCHENSCNSQPDNFTKLKMMTSWWRYNKSQGINKYQQSSSPGYHGYQYQQANIVITVDNADKLTLPSLYIICIEIMNRMRPCFMACSWCTLLSSDSVFSGQTQSEVAETRWPWWPEGFLCPDKNSRVKPDSLWALSLTLFLSQFPMFLYLSDKYTYLKIVDRLWYSLSHPVSYNILILING